jgi:hypothetical protein
MKSLIKIELLRVDVAYCSSVAEHVVSLCKALGSIPSTKKTPIKNHIYQEGCSLQAILDYTARPCCQK